jgi:predicted 2-oxoglutarate/Fe(II)-dependent dioxygenase YbiX
MDADGRFTPGPNTRTVSSRAEAEALGLDFLIADNVASEAECALLVRTFEELQELVFGASDGASFWDKRGIWYADVLKHRPEAAATMAAAMGRCLTEMKRFWKLQVPVYLDGMHMMSWKAGLFMPPHADNAYPDGKPHDLAHRDLSGVLYLNDSFEGGSLYLTTQDVLLKPRPGTLISMTGGFHHEHGVVRVESGLRITMPYFTTFTRERADPSLVGLSEAAAA